MFATDPKDSIDKMVDDFWKGIEELELPDINGLELPDFSELPELDGLSELDGLDDLGEFPELELPELIL